MAPKDQISDDNGNPPYPHFQHKKIDVRNLVYEYNWMNQYALRGATAQTWNTDNADVSEWGIVRNENTSIYPDTLRWNLDFTYAFNDPLFGRYFWHPAYGDYPVVGVSLSLIHI